MKDIKSYILKGIIFVSVLGTFLHFAYNLSGNNFIVGIFTPVNESIWEHTKLVFFPMLLYGLFMHKKQNGTQSPIYAATTLGAVAGLLFIIIAFYTYTGIIGYHNAFIDISIFYAAVIIAFYTTYKSVSSPRLEQYSAVLTLLSIVMIVLYIIFLLFPPTIPLFINP